MPSKDWIEPEVREGPAIDIVDISDDLGSLVSSLVDGRPDPAAIITSTQISQLFRSFDSLPLALFGQAAVHGCLGHRVGVDQSPCLECGLPGSHQVVPAPAFKRFITHNGTCKDRKFWG